MTTIALILSCVSLALATYAVFRKPRVTTVTIKDVPAIGHAVCAKCDNIVARYTAQEDGSVICANCG